MNNEKNYLFKVAELVSNGGATNSLGTMFVNLKTNQKIYIPTANVKNKERELDFVKTNVCKYCNKIYMSYAASATDKMKEFYTNSAEYYNYAIENNVDAKDLYDASKQMYDAIHAKVDSYVEVKEDDLTFNK